jgi:hypothetical protein
MKIYRPLSLSPSLYITVPEFEPLIPHDGILSFPPLPYQGSRESPSAFGQDSSYSVSSLAPGHPELFSVDDMDILDQFLLRHPGSNGETIS